MASGSAAAAARMRGRGRRNGGEDKVDASEVRWLISYSDYMMQLVVLFILLYSVSAADMTKLQAVSVAARDYLGVKARGRHPAVDVRPTDPDGRQPVKRSLSDILEEIKEKFGGKDAMANVDAIPIFEGIKITVRSAQFAEGSAEPPVVMDGVINEVAQFLQSHPAGRVEVRGHTSASTADMIKENAWLLSFLRAQAVADKLLGNRKDPRINPARLRITGCSSNEPVPETGTETPQGSAADRRVEIIISEERVPVK